MAPRTPDRRRPSRAETRLFERAMARAAPLQRDGSPAVPPAPDGPPAARPGLAAAPRPVATGTPIATEAPLAAGRAVGLDGRTMERLRRGRIRPTARLDLHGATRQEAHRALTAFIAEAYHGGARCVIVITGKGRISEGGGVLRQELPHWLNLPGTRGHVLGFAEAQPRDGGAGALYVLIRRRKS
jgi:DNA-nicking Smr family endonuclease